MASSGWQGQRDIQTSKYPHMALNLNVWDIARSGTTLTFKAQVRVVVTSGSISYNNASVSVTGGGSTSINIQKSTGGYVDTGTFNCTITNVSTSATTYNVSASLSAGSVASGTATWTLDIGSGASAPTGLTATLISYTDTSAKIAIHIDSYGTPDNSSGRYIEAAVLGSSSYYDPYRYHLKYEAMDNIFDVTNDSPGGDLVITPNTSYRYGGYTTNTSMYVDLVAGSFTTLPAYITGVTTNYGANNSVALTVQHAAEGSALTVTTQYSWDGSTWINASDSFSLTVTEEKKIYFRRISNAGSTPVYETTLRANGGPYLYGSVSNLSKRLDPVYASFGNYFDGHHVLTGRESSVSTDISGDDITLTRVASGSGGYVWVAYPIDATDELINKQITISGEFKTSGNFTSGPRLWWLNSANTNILSGPVASIEYIGNSGKFSVSGAIPARPSGAGKLALLLYSNIASAAQGVYTVYSNVELKANVKNISNPTSVSASVTTNGITATYDATTQTFTFNGTCNKDNTCFTCSKLLNLEAGKYSLSFFVKGGSLSNITGATKIQYQNSNGWANTILVPLGNTSASNSTTIPARPSNTNNVRFDNGVVANNYQIQIQLERGDATGSFAPFVDTKAHKLKKIYGSVGGRAKLIYDEGA